MVSFKFSQPEYRTHAELFSCLFVYVINLLYDKVHIFNYRKANENKVSIGHLSVA